MSRGGAHARLPLDIVQSSFDMAVTTHANDATAATDATDARIYLRVPLFINNSHRHNSVMSDASSQPATTSLASTSHIA